MVAGSLIGYDMPQSCQVLADLACLKGVLGVNKLRNQAICLAAEKTPHFQDLIKIQMG